MPKQEISWNRKWVTTGRGPVAIRDRAADLLRLAGFRITMNNAVGKHWEKAHCGVVHKVIVSADGSWSHPTASEEQLLGGLAIFQTLSFGRDHHDLMSCLGNNPIFGNSTDLENTA